MMHWQQDNESWGEKMEWITFDDVSGLFCLRTAHSLYQMKIGRFGCLLHLYYGALLGDMDSSYRIVCKDRGFCPNPAQAGKDRTFSLDSLPQEYSGAGNGDYRFCSVDGVGADGSRCLDLKFSEWKAYKGKYSLSGLPALFDEEGETETLEICLYDQTANVKVLLYYGVFPREDVITRAVRIENTGHEPYILTKAMSMQLDFLESGMDFIHFYGRHTMERIPEREPLMHGLLSVGSVRGASSHQHNPFVILCEEDAGEKSGSCYGCALVYSGNFLIAAEVDQIGQTRLAAGIHPDGFRWTLQSGEAFTAPEVILTYSQNGFERLSHQLHDVMRRHLIRSSYKEKSRPILINSWEAAYFDFTDERLLAIARDARELGVDLFVLDDGWFGRRNNDDTALGDWVVNEDKIKGGLLTLSDKIRDMGLGFGLWIEPEMVSEDSDLYRAHPDWCLRNPGRHPTRGRSQLNLDITRKEIRDTIMDQILAIIRDCHISYIKWDFNRNLGNIYSAALPPERQGEVFHRYVLALYEMQERLVSEFPDLLFENCAGGGGRFDAGMLYYSPQIWCSDNTDPIDRLTIQYGTSFAYPVSTFGAHVSVSPNHQTGRETQFACRSAVAQCGTFGFELDPAKMSEEEKQKAALQIRIYREDEALVQKGDYFRLTDPTKNRDYCLWELASKDRKEILVQGIKLRNQANSPVFYVRLRGLPEDAVYCDQSTGREYTGAALMYAGLALPDTSGDYQAVRGKFIRIDTCEHSYSR